MIGERCPIPVQRIRKEIRINPDSSDMVVIGDDPESLHDIPALLIRLGLEPAFIEEMEQGWRYTIQLS